MNPLLFILLCAIVYEAAVAGLGLLLNMTVEARREERRVEAQIRITTAVAWLIIGLLLCAGLYVETLLQR